MKTWSFFCKQYRKKGKEQQTRRKKRIQKNCEPHPIWGPDEFSNWHAFGLLRLSKECRRKRLWTFFHAYLHNFFFLLLLFSFFSLSFFLPHCFCQPCCYTLILSQTSIITQMFHSRTHSVSLKKMRKGFYNFY